MSVIWTRSELTSLLAAWKAAYMAASTGKSYTIGNCTLTRYDLDEIRKQIDWLSDEMDALDGKPAGIKFVKMRRYR